jgi:hypothetical protein
MYLIAVKDLDPNNALGYMFWSGFKADAQGDGSLPTFSKPMVSADTGFQENEKSLQATLFTTKQYADKEVLRLKELIHKHSGKYYEMETISADLAGSMLKLWK